jgi:RNA polymerase sigma-70 factor (ECF subfamily)
LRFDHNARLARPLLSVTVEGLPRNEGTDASATTFARLFHENSRYVWRLLRRLGVPPADVPDVAQEVFLILREKLDQVKKESSLRSFIYGIALREASTYRRSARSRREALSASLPEARFEPEQEQQVELAEARALLEAALGELDEDKRAVFVLYELEALEMKEVVEVIGCPIQTAYSRLHAARKVVALAFERAEKGAP